MIFTPAMLRYRSGGDPPLELLAARSADMRGWRLGELEPILQAAGFDQGVEDLVAVLLADDHGNHLFFGGDRDDYCEDI